MERILEQGIKALVTDHLGEGFSKRADPGKIGETILFGQGACEDIRRYIMKNFPVCYRTHRESKRKDSCPPRSKKYPGIDFSWIQVYNMKELYRSDMRKSGLRSTLIMC